MRPMRRCIMHLYSTGYSAPMRMSQKTRRFSTTNVGEEEAPKKTEEMYFALLETAKASKTLSLNLYQLIVKGLSQSGASSAAIQVMEHMRENGFQPSIEHFKGLISGYITDGNINDAVAVLRHVASIGMMCSLLAEGFMLTVLDGLIKAERHDEIREIVNYLDDCPGTTDHWKTLMKLLRFFAHIGDTVTMHSVFTRFHGIKFPPLQGVEHWHLMLMCFVKAGEVDQAQKVLDRMIAENLPVECYTFTIVMTGYVNAGQLTQASETFFTMRKLGIKPNLVCTNLLIDAFLSADNLHDAAELLQEMRHNDYSPNKHTYNSLLHHYFRMGLRKQGLDVLDKSIQDAIKMSVYTYSILIKNLLTSNKYSEAVAVLSSMRERGVPPNAVTYTTFISSYIQNGRIGYALDAWDEMRRNNIRMDADVFGPFLKHFAKTSESEKFSFFVNFMADNNIKHNLYSYTTLVQYHVTTDNKAQASLLMDRMENEGIKADNVIVECFFFHKPFEQDTEESIKFVRSALLTRQLIPSLLFYERAIKFYVMKQDAETALELVLEMQKNGFEPSPQLIMELQTQLVQDLAEAERTEYGAQ